MAKAKVKVNDRIEWLSIVPEERIKGIIKRGTILKLYTNSVLVAIDGGHDKTVVSHKRYKIIAVGESVEVANSNEIFIPFNPDNRRTKARVAARAQEKSEQSNN